MDLAATLGQRLKQCRTQRHCSAQELARVVGCTRQSISRWERGEALIDMQSLRRCASHLQVSPSYLSGLSDDPHGHSTPAPLSVPLLSLRTLPKQLPDLLAQIEHDRLEKPQARLLLDGSLIRDQQPPPLLFAVRVEDDALCPDVQSGDLLIVHPEQVPLPGEYVVAHYVPHPKHPPMIRQYREDPEHLDGFELVASHPHWRERLPIRNPQDAVILGTVIGLQRYVTAATTRPID